jgi:hypothetical protein
MKKIGGRFLRLTTLRFSGLEELDKVDANAAKIKGVRAIFMVAGEGRREKQRENKQRSIVGLT